MTNEKINETVTEIKSIEIKVNELKEQIDFLKQLLKDEFDNRKVDKIQTDLFKLSYDLVLRNVFDSASFKKDFPEEFKKYNKETTYTRLNIR